MQLKFDDSSDAATSRRAKFAIIFLRIIDTATSILLFIH